MKVREIVEKIKTKQISALEVLEMYLVEIEKKNKDLNAILEVFEDARQRAIEIDEKIKKGEPVGKLVGVPILIKDNILFEGHIACDSKSNSELVIPLYKNNVVFGVLDIDSLIKYRFDDELVEFFIEVAKILERLY